MPIVQLRKMKTLDSIRQKSIMHHMNHVKLYMVVIWWRWVPGREKWYFCELEATVSKGARATQRHTPLSSEPIFS